MAQDSKPITRQELHDALRRAIDRMKDLHDVTNTARQSLAELLEALDIVAQEVCEGEECDPPQDPGGP